MSIFDLLKKKKLPKVGNTLEDGDASEVEIPDADSAVDAIDAAIKAANDAKAAAALERKRKADEEAQRQKVQQIIDLLASRSCGCGGGD